MARRAAREVPISELLLAGGEGDAEKFLDQLRPDGSEIATSDSYRGQRVAELEARIRECLRQMRHGAEMYIGAVLHDRSVTETAGQLCVAPASVYEVMQRARELILLPAMLA